MNDSDAPWSNGDWEDPYEDLTYARDAFLESQIDYERDFAEEAFNARLMRED